MVNTVCKSCGKGFDWRSENGVCIDIYGGCINCYSDIDKEKLINIITESVDRGFYGDSESGNKRVVKRKLAIAFG